MLAFPLSESSQFVVIEPGNIRRMKLGLPLNIVLANGSQVIVAFVPDVFSFLSALGLDPNIANVTIGFHNDVDGIALRPEQVQAALQAVKNLPEVDR